MSIPISAGLQAHLAQPYQTIAWILKVTWDNGTILGFTSHDEIITYLGVDYDPVVGFWPFDVVTGSDLSVDNSSIKGILSSPSITIDDLRAGLWDGAQMEFSAVNWQNLAQGALVLRVGWLGEVKTGRDAFEAELRGLTQSFIHVIGVLTGPMCRNTLYDERCTIDPAAFTFSSTVNSVTQNQIINCSLSNPGPGGSVNITSITRANPGIVTTATPLGLSQGAPIMIANCTGMTAVNGSTFIRSPSGSTFSLGVDTSSYPAYTGSGTVTPLGGTSGYFDGGVLTWTSGLNDTLSMEVRSYVPGQLMLQLPMYYTIVAGDTFDVTAGCNKFLNTCLTKFANVINMNAEPYLPGIDKIIQIGKQL